MEQQTAAIQREKEAFQQEALELAKRLEAVIHDKFIPKSHIDADTPIDKTLNFLHAFVAVRTDAPCTLYGNSHSQSPSWVRSCAHMHPRTFVIISQFAVMWGPCNSPNT